MKCRNFTINSTWVQFWTFSSKGWIHLFFRHLFVELFRSHVEKIAEISIILMISWDFAILQKYKKINEELLSVAYLNYDDIDTFSFEYVWKVFIQSNKKKQNELIVVFHLKWTFLWICILFEFCENLKYLPEQSAFECFVLSHTERIV